jgi:hypothetical protein
MGEFFLDSESIKIDFPDGQWISVKEELSQDDSDYIMSQMAKAEHNGKGQRLDIQLGQLPLLERSILAWSFTEGEKEVPINPDTISRLRVKYRSKLVAEINRLNVKALEFVAKNV